MIINNKYKYGKKSTIPVYKYRLVPRSALKNYAPKLCNVSLPKGRRPEGNIAQLRDLILQC